MEFIFGAVGILLGIIVGIVLRKIISEKKIGSAKTEAERIKTEARKEAETAKKEALISAKEEILRQRNESEREMKERRSEITRQERRLVQKEEHLDKKTEQLEKKNEQLDRNIKENDALREQINELHQKEMLILERISGISIEEAKTELLQRVESCKNRLELLVCGEITEIPELDEPVLEERYTTNTWARTVTPNVLSHVC